jgi:hypothetical protein
VHRHVPEIGFGRFRYIHFLNNAAVAGDTGAIRERQNFGRIGRSDENRNAVIGEFVDEPVVLNYSADVDASCRLVEDPLP